MTIPNIWENKIHVPNHQPVKMSILVHLDPHGLKSRVQLHGTSHSSPHSGGHILDGPRKSDEIRAPVPELPVKFQVYQVFTARPPDLPCHRRIQCHVTETNHPLSSIEFPYIGDTPGETAHLGDTRALMSGCLLKSARSNSLAGSHGD